MRLAKRASLAGMIGGQLLVGCLELITASDLLCVSPCNANRGRVEMEDKQQCNLRDSESKRRYKIDSVYCFLAGVQLFQREKEDQKDSPRRRAALSIIDVASEEEASAE
ncbi:hypothetical protein RUND412_003377 [Rhizina undulata]